MEALARYTAPGNVRELENTFERAFAFAFAFALAAAAAADDISASALRCKLKRLGID